MEQLVIVVQCFFQQQFVISITVSIIFLWFSHVDHCIIQAFFANVCHTVKIKMTLSSVNVLYFV